jgi:hypothetical protein
MIARHHVTVSVLSGRFDGSDAGVACDWNGERDAASLLLGTELAHRADVALLADDPDFSLVHEHGVGVGENAVEYRHAVLELVETFYLPVTDGTGTARFASPSYALVDVFNHIATGKIIVDIQNHDPAHNLPTSRFWRAGNMRRWYDVKRAEAKAMRKLERKYPDAIYLVTGDSNAPQDAPFFLRAMARLFPGFRNGGGNEFGALWVKGARGAWHRNVRAHGSDHTIRRIGLTW